MRKFDNEKRKSFIKRLSDLPSLDDVNNDLTIRCKFNFSYFDSSQNAGQDFKDWTDKQLYELLEKLKDFSRNQLDYWRHQRVGGGGLKRFVIYGAFPNKSEFVHPKHIPHQVQWGRFRLDQKIRLIGFTIPAEFHNNLHSKTQEYFDKNTFYVVFLDRDHKFYITEDE